jgi:hypothetical protein
MTVYDHSTRSSGESPTWPSGRYGEPPVHSAAASGYPDETAMYERHLGAPGYADFPPGENYTAWVPAEPAAARLPIDRPEDFPARAPADWAPAHADGPPPAWTPPEKADAAPATAKNKRLALVGGIVAVAVASAGLTAGIMAAVDGAGSSASTGPGGGQAMGQGGPGGTQGAATASTNALHGTYVVSDGNGGYTTQLTQTGTVSAISSSSVTVKSDDGYSKTYVISTSTTVGSGRIADVLKGHTVRIVATSAKQKITATSITDTSLASAGGAPQN